MWEKKRPFVVKTDKKRAVFFMKAKNGVFLDEVQREKVSKVHKKKALSLVEISKMYFVYGKI